jgi:sigma-B regulation protein RsbU (phosphoserine phosphatase)
MRILLVDDDITIRRYLQAVLTKAGHEVVMASNGLEAWEIIMREQVTLVLSDWRMPELDGVELCRRLRATELSQYVYVILFTGLDEQDDLLVAFNAGADDFLTKPINVAELHARIKSGSRILQLEQRLQEKNRLLQENNEALKQAEERRQKDLQAAAKLQQEMLPQSNDLGLPVVLASRLVPADDLAGDMFSYFALDERHLGFFIIDVVGHGIPAAMLSLHLMKILSPDANEDSIVWKKLNIKEQARGGLRNLMASRAQRHAPKIRYVHRDPVEVVARLNAGWEDDMGTTYFTMIYGVIDTHTGAGTLCQAGHPYPLICRRDGAVEVLGHGGYPIGLLDKAEYDAVPFSLEPGDRLFLYSDGVTECSNPNGELFGQARLQDFLAQGVSLSASELLQKIEDNLRQWNVSEGEAGGFADDTSMMVVQMPNRAH